MTTSHAPSGVPAVAVSPVAPGPLPSPLIGVYGQMPVRPVSGRGSWLIDEDGNEWLDAYGGHAVAATGHSHPAVVAAIAAQAEKLLFYSTAVAHPNREWLAEALVERCPAPLRRVFLCNSGAEANENAMLLARKHTGRQEIVSIAGGWHGRTAACLAVTDGEKYEQGARRAGLALSRKIPFNAVEAVDEAIGPATAAVILEPVQGMSGARACTTEFLGRIRARVDAVGALLIYDEIQCGVGRSGAFTAAEVFGVAPDILTIAKGLASGLPIGAVILSDAIAAGIRTGDLGSTFGGGPVPCAAALATLEVIDREGVLENVRTVGAHLTAGARGLGIKEVEGRGLLLGLRLARPAAEVQQALFARRILTGTATDPGILRLIPPLTFSLREADLLLEGLREVLA